MCRAIQRILASRAMLQPDNTRVSRGTPSAFIVASHLALEIECCPPQRSGGTAPRELQRAVQLQSRSSVHPAYSMHASLHCTCSRCRKLCLSIVKFCGERTSCTWRRLLSKCDPAVTQPMRAAAAAAMHASSCTNVRMPEPGLRQSKLCPTETYCKPHSQVQQQQAQTQQPN